MPNHSASLKSLAPKCIAEFGKIEVLKMMTTIDEEHGLADWDSIGYNIAMQLRPIPNIKGILRQIAGDSFLEPEMRGYAILILAAFLDYSDRSFYQSLLQNEIDSFVIETLYWALERGIENSEDEHESIPNLVSHNVRPGEIIQFLLF